MAALDARIRVELDRQRLAAARQLDVLRDVHEGDLDDLTEYTARWWLTVAAALDVLVDAPSESSVLSLIHTLETAIAKSLGIETP